MRKRKSAWKRGIGRRNLKNGERRRSRMEGRPVYIQETVDGWASGGKSDDENYRNAR
jgi:hypothetical protein